jgi:hypothetical protein
MKKVTLVAFVVAQVFALSAFAQDSKPRAEVKAEAAAANKAGTIAKGEQDTKTPAATNVAPKARAEVKAEAAAANKAGTIEKGDASDTAKPAKITKMTKEEKAAARAKRKAETAKAAKAGEIVKGEGTPK